MKRHPFVGSLLAATLATGLLLAGTTSASAQNTEPTPAEPVTGSPEPTSHTTTVRPPVFSEARFACHDNGALVVATLRNPDKAVQIYMVGIHAGDIYYDYVVPVAAYGAELVEFGGLPDNTYVLQAQDAEADVVAHTRVPVHCDVRPTGTPSKTPTTSPTTGTSSATTAVPSTPVPVPTAVDAGLPGPDAQDDSNHGRTIVGAGLLAAVGLMIALGSLVVRRRRGLHQL